MAEKTKEQKQEERELLVRELMPEELEYLSDYQLRICQQIQINRVNARASKRIDGVLEGQLKTIAQALTTAPYVYLSPEIKVMAGCAVRFTTLMKAQLEDVHAELDHFIDREKPNDIRTTDYLNSLLLSHALAKFNDDDFGGVTFDAGSYQQLRTTKIEDAKTMLTTLRDERMKALGNLSPHVYQRLIEYYQAFQMAIEILSKGDEMEEALGN